MYLSPSPKPHGIDVARCSFLLAALCSLYVLGQLAYVLFGLSSPSPGTVLVCVLICVLFYRHLLLNPVHNWQLGVLLLAAISTLYSRFIFPEVSLEKQVLSIIFVAVAMMTGNGLGRELAIRPKCCRTIFLVVGGCLFVCWLLAINQWTAVGPYSHSPTSKPFFPFAEPSHFGLAFTPIVLFLCLLLKGWVRFLPALVLGLMGLVTPNTIMLLGIIVVVLLRPPLAIVFSIFAGVLLLTSSHLLPGYFTHRIQHCFKNHTCLVYLQGWEIMLSSLLDTFGLGHGFQNLAAAERGPIAERIAKYGHKIYLNRQDGGFLAVKLVGEFGVFGIALVLAATWLIARSAWDLMTRLHQKVGAIDALYHALIVGFVLELWFRGLGYFSPGVVLFFAALEMRRLKAADGSSLVSG